MREWAERQATEGTSSGTPRNEKASLKAQNRDPIERAFAAFVSRAVGMAAAAGRAAVVWQEAFEAGADLPPTAEVEVWKVSFFFPAVPPPPPLFFFLFLVVFRKPVSLSLSLFLFLFLFLSLSSADRSRSRKRGKKLQKTKHSEKKLVVGGEQWPSERRRDVR